MKKKTRRNEPLVKLMCQVLREDKWQKGDTSRFARIFSENLVEPVSRNAVHEWLNGGKGIPPKYLHAAEALSKKYGGEMTAKEFRPDLPNLITGQ